MAEGVPLTHARQCNKLPKLELTSHAIKVGRGQTQRRLTAAEKAAKKRRRAEFRTVFINGKPETKELVAGFWLWQVSSMEEAVEWARRCPNPMPGTEAELEIRPVFENEDFGEAFTPELQELEDRLRAEVAARQ